MANNVQSRSPDDPDLISIQGPCGETEVQDPRRRAKSQTLGPAQLERRDHLKGFRRDGNLNSSPGFAIAPRYGSSHQLIALA